MFTSHLPCPLPPTSCRGPVGNAEAKYQEISDTEKPHLPKGEQSVRDKVCCTSGFGAGGPRFASDAVWGWCLLPAAGLACVIRQQTVAQQQALTEWPTLLPAVPGHARGRLAAEQHARAPDGGERAHQVKGLRFAL